jgi:hypothetical protein
MTFTSLAPFARPIPYFPRLRKFLGSVTATILFQQLEYWADKCGDGFYKFLEPCAHHLYKEGDSWFEELAFSPDEFRSAFDKFGQRFLSRTRFESAMKTGKAFVREDGSPALYVSYFDKIKGTTYYLRNHSAIAELVSKVLVYTGDKVSNPRRLDSPFPVNGKSPAQLYTGDYIQEITTHTKGEGENSNFQNVIPAEERGGNAGRDLPLNFEFNGSSLNEKSHPEVQPGSGSFDKPEQLKKHVDDYDAIALLPNGRKAFPWENPGAGRNDKYDWGFAAWLYENVLKRFSGFSGDGFPGNKLATTSYLVKAHTDRSRADNLINYWNAYCDSLTAPAAQQGANLDNFLTTMPDSVRKIALNHPGKLAAIAQLWEVCDGDESLVLQLLRDEGLS